MAEMIFARTLADQDNTCEWLLNDSLHLGALPELAQAANGAPVVLLLPATDVVLMEINLPVKSQGQLKKALPFAVEDRLAAEVELYHLVWSRQQGHKVAVAAITHEEIQSCLRRFRAAHINLAGVYPETLFLPVQEGGCSVLIDRGRAALRYDRCCGGGIDQDSLAMLLEKTVAENELTQAIKIWTTEPCEELPPLETFNIVCEPIASVLHFFQSNSAEKTGLNLLDGVYRLQQQGNRPLKAWLPALTITILAAVVQYGAVATSYWSSKVQLAALQAKNQQLFKRTFPEVRRIVNLKTQAQQELLSLRKKGGNNDSDFLSLIYQSGEILKQNAALQLQEIVFTSGVLSMRLAGTEIAQIEQFKQQMEKQKRVTVKIQSAEVNGKGLVARIEISRKTS